MSNDISHTLVEIDWKTAALKGVDNLTKDEVKVLTYGITGNDIEEFRTKANRHMHDILMSNEKAIPASVSSVGYGINFNVQPYWADGAKLITEEIQRRVQKFGVDGVIPCKQPYVNVPKPDVVEFRNAHNAPSTKPTNTNTL
jgi:hypothetical protein